MLLCEIEGVLTDFYRFQFSHGIKEMPNYSFHKYFSFDETLARTR